MSPTFEFAAGALAVFLLTLPVARLARWLGWVDPRPGSAEVPDRKRGAVPVPVVGGALLLALWLLHPSGFPGAASAYVSIALAAIVGLIDDRRRGGLAPGPKVALQLAAALPHALDLGTQSPAVLLAFLVVALVAVNAANTFDHQHGFCASLGLLSLTPAVPWLGGGLLGFLPHNLTTDERGTSRVYLGDSGSHLVGMAIAVTPSAWPILALPLVDLARLSLLRLRAGSRPWRGDRRHLGHRLEQAGLGAPARVLVAVGLLLPTAFLTPKLALLVAGVGLAGVLTLCDARVAPEPDRQ